MDQSLPAPSEGLPTPNRSKQINLTRTEKGPSQGQHSQTMTNGPTGPRAYELTGPQRAHRSARGGQAIWCTCACSYMRMCVRMCVCICIYIYIYTRVYIYIYMYIWIYACIYVSMHVFIQLYVCIPYACNFVRMFAFMYVCMYSRTYVYIPYMHTDILK